LKKILRDFEAIFLRMSVATAQVSVVSSLSGGASAPSGAAETGW
jgi:hypothetical protein